MTEPVDLNPVRTLRLRHDPPFTSSGQLARAAGVHENTVRWIEEGSTNPNGATVLKLASTLGVDAADLANRIDRARLETARLSGASA